MKSFLIIAIVPLLILVSSIFAGGYNYDGGPASWNENFPKCGESNQSPININTATNPRGGPTLHMNNITNFIITNDHTIGVEDLEGRNYIAFDGVTYTFKRVNLHTPSEHHINGTYYDAEAQFVYKDQQNNVSIVAFLFKVSAEGGSKLLNSIQSEYPPKGVTRAYKSSQKVAVNLSGMSAITDLQPNGWAYRYTGSFTTPPCTGNVTWWVATSIRPISLDQFNKLRDAIGYNSRPIQPR